MVFELIIDIDFKKILNNTYCNDVKYNKLTMNILLTMHRLEVLYFLSVFQVY